MIKIWDKIKSILKRREELLDIKLATNYRRDSNAYVYEISKCVLDDIKMQSYRYIKDNPEFKNKLDNKKIVTVHFRQSVPLGMQIEVSHVLYWNGEYLFSPTMEPTSMSRDIKINNLLNG